jgi:AcrR family transcriptional regulator
MAVDTITEPANARSRRTRSALLAAARELLEGSGFEALTMTAVADRAGVTRRAAYLHFPGRAVLVGALFDYIADAEGLQESLDRVWASPDAISALDEWAAHLTRYHPRLLAVDRAVERVRHVDGDAAAHRDRVAAEKLANCRRLAAWLQRDGRLNPSWTVQTATDMLYALISSDLIEALIADRHWPARRLRTHLALLFRSTFTTPRGLDWSP